MLMIGAGGYGKSEVVDKSKELLLQQKFSVAATTGEAAALIDGSTIHTLLDFPTRKAHEKAVERVGLYPGSMAQYFTSHYR